MPRTRKQIKPAADDNAELFNPNAIATVENPMTESTSGEYAGEFFDSANRETYSDNGENDEDADGNLPPVVEGELAADDPSAAVPLGRTKAGMTEGAQAAAAELKDYMRRMSNLAADRAEIGEDIKELKKEVKGKGYDMKAFELILKIEDMSDSDKQARREQNTVNETYAQAVGIDLDLL